jgi:ribosomal protein S10
MSVLLLKERDMAIVVPEKRMEVVVFKDNGEYTAFCPELDLATAQSFPDKAIEDIVLAIKEYAEDYMKNLKAYSKSPNRKDHLSLVKQVAEAKDEWEIREMIEVRYGDIYLRPVQKSP